MLTFGLFFGKCWHLLLFRKFENNPIYFSDINGDKVKNGDNLAADNCDKLAATQQTSLDKFMNDKGITKDMNKKDFLRSGGSKEEWQKHKGNSRLVESYKSSAAYFRD